MASEDCDELGRAFLKALRGLESETNGSGDLETLVDILKRESSGFGKVRAGDPAPALRLLAIDGLLTERLGALCGRGELSLEAQDALARRIIES